MIMQVLADEGVSAIFGYSGGGDPAHLRPRCFSTTSSAPVSASRRFRSLSRLTSRGRASWRRATRAPRVEWGVPGHLGTWCHEHCYASARLHGGFVPIVVICGQVSTAAIGTDAFQEAPVPSIMGAVAKHIFLVTNPAKLEATVRTAFEIARTGRPGPVVVDIPKDVQTWEGVFQGEGLLPIPGYRRACTSSSQAGARHALGRALPRHAGRIATGRSFTPAVA